MSENLNRAEMAEKTTKELIELENGSVQDNATATFMAQNPAMSKAQEAAKNNGLRTDAVAKVVISDNKLEANMCVFAPQNSGKDITVEDMKRVLKDERVSWGIDEQLISEIAEGRLYDKVFTVAQGKAAKDGSDGYVTNRYEQAKKLVPRTLEDGSVDYRDLGLVVNVKQDDIICDITYQTAGESGMTVQGMEIQPRPGRPPVIPAGVNTVLSADGTKLFAAASGNLVFSGGRFSVETTIVIPDDVCVATGNINFIGDVVIKGSVHEGFEVNAGKTITINGSATGATITAGGDISIKNGAIACTLKSEDGDINIGFGENDTITTRGNLTSTSLIGCDIKIEGDLDCTKSPGALVGGECAVMGNFTVIQLGHKNYIHTVVSVGSVTNLVMEKDALEKQCAAIDEYIAKLNASIEFLQEKKRNGEHLEPDKESFITSSIRMKVQKAMDKKPLRARIDEIESIINSREDLSLTIKKCLYPNVRINLNSFSTMTSAEYGKCTVTCGKNDIEIK